MPNLGARGTRLREAMHSAIGVEPDIETVGVARVRISVPIAESTTLAAYRAALEVVQRGDTWGSNSEPGAVIVWTEITEPKGRP